VAFARAVIAVLHTDDVHTFSRETVDRLGQVGLGSGEARAVHDQQNVEGFRESCGHHLLEARPVAHGGVRDALVLEAVRYRMPVLLARSVHTRTWSVIEDSVCLSVLKGL
jgi:hypothetical protein